MTRTKQRNKWYSCGLCSEINSTFMLNCSCCDSEYHLKCLDLMSVNKHEPYICPDCVNKIQFHQEQLFYGNMSQSKQIETSRLIIDENNRSNRVRIGGYNDKDHQNVAHGSQIGHIKDHRNQESQFDGCHNQFYRINSDQGLVNRSQDHRSQNSVSHSRCGRSSVSRNHIERDRIEEVRQLKKEFIEEDRQRKEKSDRAYLDKIFQVLVNSCKSDNSKRRADQQAQKYIQDDSLSSDCRNEFAKRISQVKFESTSTKDRKRMDLKSEIGSSTKTSTCPKYDASRHMFRGHEIRKFQESCQQPEQVGLSTKQTKPAESRTKWIRRTSPAPDAKSHVFQGSEFPNVPESQAKICDSKLNDNKATVYELPKQDNWINRQRHESKSPSCMKSQEIPMFSSNIRKIGNENIYKMYENREFRENVEHQFNIKSSIYQWGPENQIFQRSTVGYPMNSDVQCGTVHQDEQTDKTSILGNHEKIRVEVPTNQQDTRAPNQFTNYSRIPRQFSDTKLHNIHQRHSVEFDKIENQTLKCQNVLSNKCCRNENVVKEDDLKQDSDICRELEDGRLVFDIPKKSTVGRVPEHKEMENCSSVLNNTINSNNLESDRPKVGNQRQGREFIRFEDQVTRHEVPVYTIYDQRMGFDIGKKCIIGHQGYSGPYQPRQYEKCLHDRLESSKEMDTSSSNVVSQRSMLDNPISSCARWVSESQNLENRTKIEDKPADIPIGSDKLKVGTQLEMVSKEVEVLDSSQITSKTYLGWSSKSDEWSKWYIMYSKVLKKEFHAAVVTTRLLICANGFDTQTMWSNSDTTLRGQNAYHREYSQLVSQRVGEDPEITVVNEWHQSNDEYGRPSNVIRNFGIRRSRYINEWPQLVVKSVYSTSTCKHLNDQNVINPLKWHQSRIQEHVPEISKIIQRISSRYEHKLNETKVIFMVKVSLPSIIIPNRFATWCKIVKSLLYVTRYVSTIYAKERKSTSSRTRQGLSIFNPIASMVWFGPLVHVPCHEFVVGRIESTHNFEIDQKHHLIVNQIHQRSEGYFSIEKCGVQSKHEIGAEKLSTEELKIHRRVYHQPFGVIRYKKSDQFRTAWLNSKYQRFNHFVAHQMQNILKSMDMDKWQWNSTRLASSNRYFVYLKGDHWPNKKRMKIDNKAEDQIFYSSIASRALVAILEYSSIPWKELKEVVHESSLPTSIGGGQLFKVWIIWSKVKMLLSWVKSQVVKWTKVSTFVLSNLYSKSSYTPLVSQHTGGSLKKPTRSASIVSNGQARRRRLWKSAHKSAVLDVIQSDDGLALGLDRETGGSVRIADNTEHMGKVNNPELIDSQTETSEN